MRQHARQGVTITLRNTPCATNYRSRDEVLNQLANGCNFIAHFFKYRRNAVVANHVHRTNGHEHALTAEQHPLDLSRPPLRLPVDLARVLRDRWPRPVTLDELAEACDRPVGALLAELTRARLRGELAEGVDGVRLRRAPA